jgi:membrane-anchored protein YejM (alkaline phosphatase superfamily)
LRSKTAKLTHDDLNQAARADPLVSDFLKRNEDYLRDAFVIVLGDHGNRYGPTLSTYAGHVETVMPAVHFYLPPKLNQQYPHLQQYLKDNHDRLV